MGIYMKFADVLGIHSSGKKSRSASGGSDDRQGQIQGNVDLANESRDRDFHDDDFIEEDFTFRKDREDIGIDTNFAAQSFWKDVLKRFLRKKSAVVGLVIIIIIIICIIHHNNLRYIITSLNIIRLIYPNIFC